MKTSHYLLVAAVAGFGATLSGCFDGPHGIPGNHRNNDAPVVLITSQPEGLVSGPAAQVNLTFTAYDPDSSSIILWDKCPYPGGQPILRMGWSGNGGTTFQPIEPANLVLNSAALVVPTCSEVENFDESIRLLVETSGSEHTISWDTTADIPAASDVIFRVSVNDGSFTSDVGDTTQFRVVNAPSFELSVPGMRPGQSFIDVDLTGSLTSWDGTTVIGATTDGVTMSALVVSSADFATATVTHGPSTEQRLRSVTLETPGAGPGGTLEVATGYVWTCPGIGQPVVQFESLLFGDGPQFVCDQADFTVTGGLAEGDRDVIQFVANSAGLASMTLSWTSDQTGVETDYDMYLEDVDGNLMLDPAPFGFGGCGSTAKPETCILNTPLVAGDTYFLTIEIYTGETQDDGVTYTATFDVP